MPPPPLPAPPPVRLVLLRPRNPENVGAVARAMKNFGASDWAIAELGTHDFGAMRRVAVHAEDLLDRPRLVRTLDEAVADCAWVVGTSSRAVKGKRRLSPAEVARETWERAREGRTAIVFGDERSGLTREEILRCHDLSAIPSDEAQPSLNLAQAALVYCYALRCAAPVERAGPERAVPGASGAPAALDGGATDGELSKVEEALREVLRGAGFLRGPERHAVRDLAAVLRRARPSKREARLWLAALKVAGKRPPAG